MNKGGMRYFKKANRNSPLTLAFASLSEEQRLAAITALNGSAQKLPMDNPPPECQGEPCWEFMEDYRLAAFKWKNKRPMIRVGDNTYVPAQDVALFIKLGRDKLAGMTASHLCGNRRCMNPAHMAEMTLQENKAYGMQFEMDTAELKALAAGKRISVTSHADSVLEQLGYGPRKEAAPGA